MNYIEEIKTGIEKLYKTNPKVHISTIRARPKRIVTSSPAKIVGVYENIFQVEECGEDNSPTRYTVRYSDVLVGQVKVEELESISESDKLNKD